MFLYIKSRYINYEIEFNRKVTIIQGDSGTGKTKIVEIFRRFVESKAASVSTSNGVKVEVFFPNIRWETIINSSENRLFIIDEECKWITSKRFTELVHRSNNYFIIISRDPLKGLNYSYKEIYEMKKSGKFNKTVRKYDSYINTNLDKRCEVVLVEDSNSGLEFYKSHIQRDIVSTEGKAKFTKAIEDIRDRNYKNVGIIADGAAFGSEIEKVVTAVGREKHLDFSWFIPECTESVLVESGILNFKKLLKFIKSADKNKFSSYETMYFKLLKEETENTPALYTKTYINTCYTKNCCHKSCPVCKFRTNVDKKKIINEIIFGINEEDSNDKLLF